MINLRLERLYLRPTYTIGKLYVDGKYFCDTLEDKVRDYNQDGDLNDPGEEKVYGETAIPYGRYRIIITWFPRHKRDSLQILDVNNFTGIFIHSGTDEHDTLGCILVGKNKIKGKLIDSRYTEVGLFDKVKSYMAVGHEIYINII